ncbi:ribosomal protection-like ABC-F family protein [Enterococcus sp. HY326]|uniref:ribosomal protection-like ABC-F family protein n=1 Tax=Enterococcus sp. HY326 TaxID=2971265 RepID=UPI0022408051|nr:ABC-F type ribosomal protection protein [Enterococcus sp. HY326]
MTTIKIENLSFGYDRLGTLLFDQAQLVIDGQWKLGLVGRNGRGKTTLLKLLQGQLPYQGKISHSLAFDYFPKKVLDSSELTYYALSNLKDFELWQLERELNLLACDPEVLWRPFETLSGGEQTKVLLALMFIEEGYFPLIDEPTNHLDIVGRQQVAQYLQKKKQGYILVSHDREFLDETVNHILAIEKNQLVLYQGNFSVYEDQKARQDAYEQAQNIKLKKEIGRLQQTAIEKAEWSRNREKDKLNKSKGFIDTEYRRKSPGAIGADAARMMKRSKAILQRVESQISEKSQLLKNIETIDGLKMSYLPSYHRRILQLENLVLSYQNQPLFQPINVELLRGECLAVTGANGSGKSSLLAAILAGFAGEQRGEIYLPQGLLISRVRQNYENNQGKLIDFAAAEGLDYPQFLNNLRKLGMERNVFDNDIQEMSMGQRKKVELAKSLSQTANLFIWDEPLNYLDVFNQDQILGLLKSVQPTMILIEHDSRFVEAVADKIISL